MVRTAPAACVRKKEIISLQEMLKAIGDANRLRILCLLFEGEKCVCDIEQKLLISQPLASHHLGVLREAGMVVARRKGTWSYYSLKREAIEDMNSLFVQVLGAERFPEGYPQRDECDEPIDKVSAAS
jgi:ArsR family transcriptional regulator